MTEVPLMVMPWHRPDPCKPLKMQTDAAFKSSYLDYLATLRLDSDPLDLPLSSIAGTIGPASNNVDMLVELMKVGMSIAVVPLALGTRQAQLDTIANIRTANTTFTNMRDMVYPLGIAVQTKGPGLRVGGLVKDVPVMLPLHHKLTLTTDKAWRTKGTEHYLYINLPEMCHILNKADILLVGSGVIILEVENVDQTECKCVVVGGGEVESYMPVSIPDVPLNLPPLTDEDEDDLRMAAEMGVDIVVATHTQNKNLIQDIRKILDESDGGSGIKIWAQIETNVALKNLECILEVVDAIVLSRLNLLQDIPVEKLFLAQKIALSACNKAGVPVYVSSHFLPSMQVATTPSIAEVNDVTSAILDGVDGFLMRNTVSHGKHPDIAIRTLTKICVEAEAAVWHHQTFSYLNANAPAPLDPTHSIAIAAVEAALKSSASVILLVTTSGRSAQLVARYRPRCPILAVTRYGQVARQLNSWRAIVPLHYVDTPLPEWTREVDVRFQFAIEFAKHKGIVRPGDVMVLLNGWRQGAGFTNTIRVVYASDSFPWVYPHKLPETIPSDDVVEQEENSAGEPSASTSRVVTVTGSVVVPPSLSSRLKSMEEDYRKIATDRSQEIEDILLSSVRSLKTGTVTQERTGTVRKDQVHEASSAISHKLASKLGANSDIKSYHSGSKVVPDPSVRYIHGEDKGRASVVSVQKATVLSTKPATVLGTKPATVVSVKPPTIVSTKPPTVLSAKHPTVVSVKPPTVLSVKNPTVIRWWVFSSARLRSPTCLWLRFYGACPACGIRLTFSEAFFLGSGSSIFLGGGKWASKAPKGELCERWKCVINLSPACGYGSMGFGPLAVCDQHYVGQILNFGSFVPAGFQVE
ncbi:pyruvate kinase-like [Macrosteles quadrilineatus]|uniref:pyruvate kinase-like n=1 Tax=Macrosteles quadrilineatus TaxID=74068 RepID=UPI0023E14DB4|nr:pyruvate kinase-like [Macrosteles quadrilineatus]